MVFIIFLDLIVPLKFLLLLNAEFEYILDHGFRFARHGTLISGDLAGLEKNAVCGNLHALNNIKDISNQKLVLVNFSEGSRPVYGYCFLAIGHRV